MVARKSPAPRGNGAGLAITVGVVAAGSLVALGLVMVLSAGSVSALQHYGSSYYYFFWQIPAALGGAAAAWVVARTDYRRWRSLAAPAFLGSLVMLSLVLVSGRGAYGARRWIGSGVFTFQPSEFAKLAVVLYCSHVCARRAGSSTGALVGPPLAALGAIGTLVLLEPDLGTTVAIALAVTAVIVVAGASARSIAAIVTAGAVASLVLGVTAGYRRARILSFLDPWADPGSSGYQLVQSLIALGGGGLTGVGMGASRQKWSFLPNAHTDFIFAIIGEELGLLGTLAVLLLFGALAWSGAKIALRAPDLYGALLAAGITAWLVAQAIINMGTVTGLLPVTGIPLPFVSYGSSQLLSSLVAVGVLVSVGRAGATRPGRR